MVAPVQSVANNNGGGAANLVLTVAPTVGGNLIVVSLGMRSTHTIAASGVSDNISGTAGWVIVNPSGAQNPDGLTTNIPAFAYKLSVAANVTTITITLDSSGVCGGFATEFNYSGFNLSFIDVRISSNGGGAVTSWTTQAINASGAAIGVGIASAGTTGLTMAASGSWVAMSGTGITSGSNTNVPDADQIFGETQIFGSGGNYAAAGTTTSTGINSGTILFLTTPIAGGGSGKGARTFNSSLGIGI